jgi:hypothetical protein
LHTITDIGQGVDELGHEVGDIVVLIAISDW